jgi:hypothetical protein
MISEIPDKPSDTSKKCQPCENCLVDPVGKTACWRANQPSLATAKPSWFCSSLVDFLTLVMSNKAIDNIS